MYCDSWAHLVIFSLPPRAGEQQVAMSSATASSRSGASSGRKTMQRPYSCRYRRRACMLCAFVVRAELLPPAAAALLRTFPASWHAPCSFAMVPEANPHSAASLGASPSSGRHVGSPFCFAAAARKASTASSSSPAACCPPPADGLGSAACCGPGCRPAPASNDRSRAAQTCRSFGVKGAPLGGATVMSTLDPPSGTVTFFCLAGCKKAWVARKAAAPKRISVVAAGRCVALQTCSSSHRCCPSDGDSPPAASFPSASLSSRSSALLPSPSAPSTGSFPSQARNCCRSSAR
mmetsp:Transcript_31968/g.90768  ORF Transcript_31968/g.90768 Transcript_31968/m.90768 type:complete len:291 (-) Transcript_31968:1592-2464(-)